MPRIQEERDGGQFYTGTGTGTDACETDVGDHPGGTEERSGCNADSATGTGTFEDGDVRETWDATSALAAFPPADGWVHTDMGPCDCCASAAPCCDYLTWPAGTEVCLVASGGTGTCAYVDGQTMRLRLDDGTGPGGYNNYYPSGPDPIGFTCVESYTGDGRPTNRVTFQCILIDGVYYWRVQYLDGINPPQVAALVPITSCTGLLATFSMQGDPGGIPDGCYCSDTFTVEAYRVLSTDPCPPTTGTGTASTLPKWWCAKQAFDGTSRRKCLQGATVALDGPFDTEGDCTGACPEPTSWCVRFQDYDGADQPVGGSYLECVDLGVDPTEPVTSGSATNPGAVRREGTIEDGPWAAEDCPGACPPCGGDGGGTPGSGTATVDCTDRPIYCVKTEIRDGAGNPLSDATYACQLDTDGPPWTHVGQTVSQPIEGGSIVSEAIACYPDDGSCDAECGTTVTGGDAARKNVTVTPAGEVVPVPQARPPARPVRERPETPQGVIRRVREGSGQAVPRPVRTTLPVARPNRCEHLGRRTERKYGCNGWKCRHDCGLGLPAVPGEFCQTCPSYEDSGEKF